MAARYTVDFDFGQKSGVAEDEIFLLDNAGVLVKDKKGSGTLYPWHRVMCVEINDE